jgi:ATP-binding cassette subfamily B protein
MMGNGLTWAVFQKQAIESVSGVVKLCKVLNYPQSATDKAGEKPSLPLLHDAVRFENVHFTYPGGTAPILANFNLTMGTYICVCGGSGSGKSTLINLLMRFFAEQSDKITVDGRDIKLHNAKSLRDQIGVVFQESVISNATISENIRLGKLDATQGEVEEAAKSAGVHAQIMALPQGYNTLLGDNSTQAVSGGQAQRICLARALVRKPRILVLDEATSALDPAVQAEVVHDLLALRDRGETTIISVTHRLSTVRNADKIVVLDKGGLAEEGTFAELLANKANFYALVQAEDL